MLSPVGCEPGRPFSVLVSSSFIHKWFSFYRSLIAFVKVILKNLFPMISLEMVFLSEILLLVDRNTTWTCFSIASVFWWVSSHFTSKMRHKRYWKERKINILHQKLTKAFITIYIILSRSQCNDKDKTKEDEPLKIHFWVFYMMEKERAKRMKRIPKENPRELIRWNDENGQHITWLP